MNREEQREHQLKVIKYRLRKNDAKGRKKSRKFNARIHAAKSCYKASHRLNHPEIAEDPAYSKVKHYPAHRPWFERLHWLQVAFGLGASTATTFFCIKTRNSY